MSGDPLSNLKALVGYDNPKEVELVQTIIEKTRAGKITWERTPSSLVANVPGMQLSFVRASSQYSQLASILGVGSEWDIFSIRSHHGGEIMKVEQPAPSLLLGTPPSAPPPRSKLVQAVDELYSVANVKGQGDVDKAINVIKNL